MKCDPESLTQELDAARTNRDAHIAAMDDMVRRMHQRDYKGFEDSDFAPENHEGEYVGLMLPKLAFSEPRVKVRCRTPGPGRMEAVALRYALNQWSEDICLSETMQQVVVDYLLNFGVYYTTQEPQPGGSHYESPNRPHWPKVQRLSQRQFLMDPLCGIFKYARWAGHEYAIEKEALIEMATNQPELGWDVAALEELDTTQEFDWRENMDDAPDREEFRIARLWVPGKYEPGMPGPEEGYNGTIYTLVNGQVAANIGDWVRQPIPAYCPRFGPYALAGAYGVPDSPWPLGPLTMQKGRVDELNAHAVAASKAMAEYKRLVLIDSAHPDLAQALKRPDQFVIPIKGLNTQNIMQVEIGGLTKDQIDALALLRDRLDRQAGMSDAQRGNTDGDVSATADAIASESSTVRIAYLKQRHTQALVQVYQTAAFYMLHDDRVILPLNDQAATELGAAGQSAYFVGGAAVEVGSGVNPDDMRFEIEPQSMDYVGQGVARQQFLQALQLSMTMAQQMPMMPHYNWKDAFTKLGDAFNDDDWSHMVNTDLAAMMGGAPGALPATPTPMFASMAGSPGGMGAPKPGAGAPGLAAPAGFQGGMGTDRGMFMQNASKPGRMAGQAAGGGFPQR